jgi:hypothetical protein
VERAPGGEEWCEKVGRMPGGGGAYFAFLKAKRGDVVAKNPGMKVTDVAKLLGGEWRKLSDGEKAKWKAKAESGEGGSVGSGSGAKGKGGSGSSGKKGGK